jgi:hypothetical protein
LDVNLREDNVWSAEPKGALYNPLTKDPFSLCLVFSYTFAVIAAFLDVTPYPGLFPKEVRERLGRHKRWEALGDGIADAGIALCRRKRPAAEQGRARYSARLAG